MGGMVNEAAPVVLQRDLPGTGATDGHEGVPVVLGSLAEDEDIGAEDEIGDLVEIESVDVLVALKASAEALGGGTVLRIVFALAAYEDDKILIINGIGIFLWSGF